MKFYIEAACGCNMGKIRKNNEDNFYFDGKCLEMKNQGLKYPVEVDVAIGNELHMAVFDGMGGENFGENASYVAAHRMQQMQRELKDYFIPVKKYLNRMAEELNDAVLQEQKEMKTERMGSTMVSLYFTNRFVYSCNLGDSRAYRLREGEFLQISEDHVAPPQKEGKKAPLSQYLGVDSEEFQVEPYIAKGELKRGDKYILCSDGLTDMLSNLEITDIMLRYDDVNECVENLISTALEHGGRDNVTVIVCKIK